jgi:hypothetical protein
LEGYLNNITDVRIKCGHCGDYHATIAEVRACSVKGKLATSTVVPPITERQLNYVESLVTQRVVPTELAEMATNLAGLSKHQAGLVIEIMLKQPFKAKPALEVPDSIPDGRYAYMSEEYGKIVFYRIVTKRDGVTRKVQKVLGSPGDFRYTQCSDTEASKCIAAIIDDPLMHSQLFGAAVGACGVCGSPLTDPESIRLGIGPICLKKYDW